MKRTVFLSTLLIAVFVTLASEQAFAQDKVPVKVKSSEVVTGVVVVHVEKDGKTIDLQCNQGVLNCKALPSGTYLMVQLPKNYGMYDCKNVEIFRGDAEKPDQAVKVGAYCMVE